MTPPYSESTEAAVVGACIVWPGRVLEAVLDSGLEAEDFYVPRFARAFWAIEECMAGGEPVDHHTVTAHLGGDKRAVADAIAEAGNTMPDNAPAWAHHLVAMSRCRAMLPALCAAVRAAEAGQHADAEALCRAALEGEEVEAHVVAA